MNMKNLLFATGSVFVAITGRASSSGPYMVSAGDRTSGELIYASVPAKVSLTLLGLKFPVMIDCDQGMIGGKFHLGKNVTGDGVASIDVVGFQRCRSEHFRGLVHLTASGPWQINAMGVPGSNPMVMSISKVSLRVAGTTTEGENCSIELSGSLSRKFHQDTQSLSRFAIRSKLYVSQEHGCPEDFFWPRGRTEAVFSGPNEVIQNAVGPIKIR